MSHDSKCLLILSITLMITLTFKTHNIFAADMKALEKAEIDVTLQVGDEKKGIIKTIQYTGVTRKDNLQSDQVDPWFVPIESEPKLKDFLRNHNYRLPQINFADNYVYLLWGIGNPPYLHPQITEYKVTIVRFDDGKLTNAGTSSVLVAGKERSENPFTFLIFLIRKSDIK